MARRARDAWRDQRGSGHEGTDTRTGASGPDMWPDPQCPHKAERDRRKPRR
jgi:hypothetical protein